MQVEQLIDFCHTKIADLLFSNMYLSYSLIDFDDENGILFVLDKTLSLCYWICEILKN